MYLPPLKQKAAQQAVTNVFAGINRAQEISDGEFRRAMNLSSREFPMLCPRKARGIGDTISGTYKAILEKNGKLVKIIDNQVIYGEDTVDLTLSADEPKTMVGMGAYVVIFPDKKYFNSLDLTDCGSIEASYESAGNITYDLARLDGSDFGNITKGPTQPEEPVNGQYWLDTSSTPHRLMLYSAITDAWTIIQTVYTRITAAGISDHFSAGDTVEISGASAGTGTVKGQTEALNGSQYIYDKGENWITVLGLLEESVTQTTGSIILKRECPDMDFVVEESNRLWGCYYGPGKDGQTLNEIYACKLGDFRNWRVYQGISTDSYAVSIGSDGPFTGAIAYGGMPMFFKADGVHKIYGNKPSNYQVLTTQMHGVKAGSGKSLVNVDGTIFYLSIFGVEGYDGSMPERISKALGEDIRNDGVAGAINGKYYLCVTEDDGRHLYVYDPKYRIWNEENTEDIKQFVSMGGDLYMMMDHRIDTALGSQGRSEGFVDWWAETGLIGWEQRSKRTIGAADDKYITRYQFRTVMPVGSKFKCALQYNGAEEWEEKLSIENAWSETRTILMPVYPRRCDHMRMRLEGKGEIKLHSITKTISSGGDGRHG